MKKNEINIKLDTGEKLIDLQDRILELLFDENLNYIEAFGVLQSCLFTLHEDCKILEDEE